MYRAERFLQKYTRVLQIRLDKLGIVEMGFSSRNFTYASEILHQNNTTRAIQKKIKNILIDLNFNTTKADGNLREGLDFCPRLFNKLSLTWLQDRSLY